MKFFKRLLCLIVSIATVCLFPAGCYLKNIKDDFSENSNKSEFIVSSDNEFSEVTVYKEYAMINLINPGLDTADITVVMYSLKDNKETARVNLGEGQWCTGNLDNGFFAVEEESKKVYFYDFNGKLTFETFVETNTDFLTATYVSTDGKFMIYENLSSCEIILYEFSSRKIYSVGKTFDKSECCGYKDGHFYIKSGAYSLIKVNTENKTAITSLSSAVLSFVTIYGATGNGEPLQLIYTDSESSNDLKYINYCKVDEVVADITNLGIITVSSDTEGDILRIYNTDNGNYKEAKLQGEFSDCSVYNENKLLVSLKEQGSFRFKILDINSKPDNTVSEFNNQNEIKNNEKETEVSVSSLPNNTAEEHYIKNVPVISQQPDFPTGCESVAAVMALKYIGYSISVSEFTDNYLAKSSEFFYFDGVKYGPDPSEYFIGSPRSKGSYGCFAPVIKKALEKYLKSNYSVVDLSGNEMSYLCNNYISRDIPVMVWVTILMSDTYNSAKWVLNNGETFYWPANEHCMLLIGYDKEYYYFNDPYTGKEVKYRIDIAQKRYSQLGKQALAIE